MATCQAGLQATDLAAGLQAASLEAGLEGIHAGRQAAEWRLVRHHPGRQRQKAEDSSGGAAVDVDVDMTL